MKIYPQYKHISKFKPGDEIKWRKNIHYDLPSRLGLNRVMIISDIDLSDNSIRLDNYLGGYYSAELFEVDI